ncbi:hypothetical protein GCM10010329_60560 [Streptomyces spiroverticillatus]|uniref:Uncharacterized protein n=1 Tax=Streptomyces finlayi TaxID=67296 RepID=A0A918X4J0_9ACTN|nr:hypothetical protein GCM10010329_60560 [Streptomyces spiroverticillatus]GHD09663.1 hypothetical protein GCM10010334_64220 [Streptomyces finlayi]
MRDPGTAEFERLAARGRLPALAHGVLHLACRNGASTGPGPPVMAFLHALPDADRLALGRIWAHWLPRVPLHGTRTFEEFGRTPTQVRTELLTLASGIVRGLDGGLLAAQRCERLDGLSRLYEIGPGTRDWELALAELDAGRPPGPAVVAVFRRTALAPGAPPALREAAAVLPGPALNPGEAWADLALREASAGPLEALLAHPAPPTARTPSARWARTARTVLARAGPEVSRQRLHGWCAAFGLPRTVPLSAHRSVHPDTGHPPDPYNCLVLRGAAWSLGLLPPRPGTAHALAALAITALRPLRDGRRTAPGVADAAITALALTGGDPTARDQLTDLAHRVTHRPTARRIAAALDQQGR